MADAYTAEDFPRGLTCMDCGCEFIEGQPIAERLIAVDEHRGQPVFVEELVCVACSLKAAEA